MHYGAPLVFQVPGEHGSPLLDLLRQGEPSPAKWMTQEIACRHGSALRINLYHGRGCIAFSFNLHGTDSYQGVPGSFLHALDDAYFTSQKNLWPTVRP